MKLLRISPSLHEFDLANHGWINAELFGKVFPLNASSECGPDGGNRLVGNFGVVMAVANYKAVAINSILSVLPLRTGKKVSGIHAFGVVACMA
jgi:hypothetical protein